MGSNIVYVNVPNKNTSTGINILGWFLIQSRMMCGWMGYRYVVCRRVVEEELDGEGTERPCNALRATIAERRDWKVIVEERSAPAGTTVGSVSSSIRP
jgi:hypothetical protein